MNREANGIYVTEKDRCIRFGFEWFLSFVRKFGSDIVVVKNEALSPQREMIQDFYGSSLPERQGRTGHLDNQIARKSMWVDQGRTLYPLANRFKEALVKES